MQLICPPRNRTKFLTTIALLALCPSLVASAAHASTNGGLDTPTGASSLPLAVEGVEGMTLVTQSPTTGPVYVGIGTATPQTTLDVNGPVRMGAVTTNGACSPAGSMAYDYGANEPVYCNGSIWTSMSSSQYVCICPQADVWHYDYGNGGLHIQTFLNAAKPIALSTTDVSGAACGNWVAQGLDQTQFDILNIGASPAPVNRTWQCVRP